MSVLIKGMEMPKSCWQCQLLEGHRDDGLCKAANRWLDDDEYFGWYQYPEGDIDINKPLNCPLVEVPTPHGRLIDADALMEKKNTHIDVLADWRYVRVSTIEDAPTVIESDDSLSCGIRKNFQQKSTVDNGACSADETSEKVQEDE